MTACAIEREREMAEPDARVPARAAAPACCVAAGCLDAVPLHPRWRCLCAACHGAEMLAAAALLAPGHPAWADLPAPPEAADHDSSETAHGSINLGYIVAAGKSNKDDEALATLQLGGHEPNRDGIPLHLLTLSAEVEFGPHFAAFGSVMERATSGERGKLEVEEAHLTAGAANETQLKIGRFFTEVGRLNPQHFEDAAFVDKPVIHARLFGEDQLSNEGLRVRLPLARLRSRLTVGVQDAAGEIASSFVGEAGEEVGGYPLLERDSDEPADWLYHVNWDATLAHGLRAGIFAVHGPNASGLETKTTICGTDFTFAWRADAAVDAPPVMSWHTELLYRRYEAGDAGDPGSDVLIDKGLVTQALWSFRPRWTAGLRFDYAAGNGDRDPTGERDRRSRITAVLTWSPNRYVRARLQGNRDSAHQLDSPARSVWLQLRLTTGEEGPHDGAWEPQ